MTTAIDEDRLHAFVGKMLGDLGGGMSVPTVRLGFRLGLFDALNEAPATASELAARAGGFHERYVREWALAQAGEARMSEVIRDGGFAAVRRATDGPFNMLLDAR